MKVNILILNYNGKKLLEECLPSLVKASLQSNHNCKVSVIDNVSVDDSVVYLRETFPHVTVYKAKENKVLCSYNEIIKNTIDDDVVILLNNDIKVDENFVDYLVEVFDDDPDTFLATPKCLSFDGKKYEGSLTKVQIKYGMFWASSVFEGYEEGIDARNYTFQAGFGAFHRKKFLQLNGYDDLYFPGRLEDSDICFRAWKQGWKCYYEPKSIIYHKGGASFKAAFGLNKMAIIDAKNTFLFMWKNLSNCNFITQHIIFLIPRLVHALCVKRVEFVIGFYQALKMFPLVLKKRKKANISRNVSDKEIFAKLGV